MESRFIELNNLTKAFWKVTGKDKFIISDLTAPRDGVTFELADSPAASPKSRIFIDPRTNFLAAAQRAVAYGEAKLKKASCRQDAALQASVQKYIDEAKSILTAIYAAAKDILKEKKSNIDEKTGYSLFWFAVQCMQDAEECEAVLKSYLKGKNGSNDDLTHQGNIVWLHDLFEKKHKLLPKDDDETIVFTAINLSNVNVARMIMLLDSSCAFTPNKDGYSPAQHSASNGKLSSLKLLRELETEQEHVKLNPPIIETTSALHLTTLMFATIGSQHDTIEWLCVNAPQLVNMQDVYGVTALVKAVEIGDTRAAAILLQHRADITIATGKKRSELDHQTNISMTPLDIAFAEKKTDVILAFTEAYDGCTLLHLAIAENAPIVMQQLLKHNHHYPNDVNLLTIKTGENTAHPNLTPVALACKLNRSEPLYAMLAHCFERCEKLDETQAKETILQALKRNFALFDKLLGLTAETFDAASIEASKLETPLIGLLTKILPYIRLRNNGKQFHNHVSEDKPVLRFAAESAKYADRAINEYFGISISSTLFATARGALDSISKLEPYLGDKVQILESYDECDKLLVAWKLIENIVLKRDLVFGFSDREKRTLEDGRLYEMTGGMIAAEPQMQQRSSLRSSK